jgi:hypothetical protein
MLSAYTWQHTIGQSEENEWLEPQNTHDLQAERGNNGPDYRHQFTSAWSYEIPIGPKKRFLPSTGPTRWFNGRLAVEWHRLHVFGTGLHAAIVV